MSPALKSLIWLDVQILRVATFGRSRPGETISAAAWALEADSKWQGRLLRPLIDGLFYFVQKTIARRRGNGSVIFINRSSRGSNDKTRA